MDVPAGTSWPMRVWRYPHDYRQRYISSASSTPEDVLVVATMGGDLIA